MDRFGLAKEKQRPLDTFSTGEVPSDQLANFASCIGRKMRSSLPKAEPPYFKIISVINQRLNSEPVSL